MNDPDVPAVWDLTKAANNERKHGVTFEEAATVFLDPLEATIPDPDHSHGEDRWVSMGYSDRGRLLVVVYVERGPLLRIISARLANKREQGAYEESQ